MNDPIKPLLAIKSLHTRFHTLDGMVNAVDGVDFEVYRGETLGLVGESGCGKSVTALSILQLLRCPPAEIQGEILFEGRQSPGLRPGGDQKNQGGVHLDDFPGTHDFLKPGVNDRRADCRGRQTSQGHQPSGSLEMGGGNASDGADIPARARAREYPHKLSGGMRQRAMIAMALSCNPQLILADEPTTALDVTIQAQIMNLMVRLKDEFKTAIVLITHDLGIIAEMASRVVVMYAGKVVEEAPVKELFKDPRHPYTQGLLGSIPVIGRKAQTGRRLQEIPGIVPRPLETPIGCRFHPRCSRAMDICRNQDPPMIHLTEYRRVNCWLDAS